MAFSKKQDEAINNWFKAFQPKCSICGHDKFTPYTNFILLNMYDPSSSTMTISRGNDDYLGFICMKCGNLLHVNAAVAKVPKQ